MPERPRPGELHVWQLHRLAGRRQRRWLSRLLHCRAQREHRRGDQCRHRLGVQVLTPGIPAAAGPRGAERGYGCGVEARQSLGDAGWHGAHGRAVDGLLLPVRHQPLLRLGDGHRSRVHRRWWCERAGLQPCSRTGTSLTASRTRRVPGSSRSIRAPGSPRPIGPATILCTKGSTTGFRIAAHKTRTVTGAVPGSCVSLIRAARGHQITAKLTSKPRTPQAAVIRIVKLFLG